MFVSKLYAMSASATAGAEQPSLFAQLTPILIMFIIFYFLLIRPQQKKAKEHKMMLSALKKGDKIITSGGIHGVVTSLDDDVVKVEISDKVNVKVSRADIKGVFKTEIKGK